MCNTVMVSLLLLLVSLLLPPIKCGRGAGVIIGYVWGGVYN